MAPQSTLISALITKTQNTRLHVRAARIWEATNKDDKKLLNTKVVFIDEKASQIMLTMWNNQKEDYFPLLKEGGVYNISDFRIVPGPKNYRVVDADLALSFYHKTRVVSADDTDLIPCYKFQLTSFDDIPALLWDTKKFIEVMGMVRKYGEPETASNGAKKMEVLLVDNRDQEMIITLWEEKATQFKEGLESTNGAVAFVVITGLLAKKYSGNNIILSSGNPTKSYFNIDYSPLKELMEARKATASDAPETMLPPARTQFVTTDENSMAIATIGDILDAEIPDGKQMLRFICEATIINVSEHDKWYYNTCPKCPKGIRFENNKFYRDACSTETEGCIQRYRVTVGVQDHSGKTTFTLFNKEAQRLIGIPIDNIISEIGQDKLAQGVPPMLNNVVGKKCAFEVKVTAYNQDGRAGYTVARLSEVATPGPATEELDTKQEAGPKKKAKVF